MVLPYVPLLYPSLLSSLPFSVSFLTHPPSRFSLSLCPYRIQKFMLVCHPFSFVSVSWATLHPHPTPPTTTPLPSLRPSLPFRLSLYDRDSPSLVSGVLRSGQNGGRIFFTFPFRVWRVLCKVHLNVGPESKLYYSVNKHFMCNMVSFSAWDKEVSRYWPLRSTTTRQPRPSPRQTDRLYETYWTSHTRTNPVQPMR